MNKNVNKINTEIMNKIKKDTMNNNKSITVNLHKHNSTEYLEPVV